MARRQLDHARVVITGASSGIGHQLALQLGKRGCRVLLNARRKQRLLELAEQVTQAGGQPLVVAGDITEPAVREEIKETCQQAWQGLDVLINNAGVGAMGPFAEASEERLRRIMEVNFFAPAELTRTLLPLLLAGTSSMIVNMGSVVGHRSAPLKSDYCAAKFALHGWSDALRAELADQGIDVLLVSPSTTDSEFFDRALEDNTNKNWKVPYAQRPEYVARRTIRAIEKGNHEIILSWPGWAMVWLDRLFPTLTNHLVARFGK